MGIFVFIEYIALFFLKQYRVNMEEFRYYESVMRDRESTLAHLALAVINKDDEKLRHQYEEIFRSNKKATLSQISTNESTNPLSKTQTDLLKAVLDKVLDFLTIAAKAKKVK